MQIEHAYWTYWRFFVSARGAIDLISRFNENRYYRGCYFSVAARVCGAFIFHFCAINAKIDPDSRAFLFGSEYNENFVKHYIHMYVTPDANLRASARRQNLLPALIAQQKLFRFSSLRLLFPSRPANICNFTCIISMLDIQIVNRWKAKIGWCAFVPSEIAHLLPRFRIPLLKIVGRSPRKRTSGSKEKHRERERDEELLLLYWPFKRASSAREKNPISRPSSSYPCIVRDATGQKAKIRTRACTHAWNSGTHEDTRKKIRPIRARRLGMHAILR